jgi:hypothetical protein
MIRQIAAGVALLALLACGKNNSNQTAAADSLNRDLQLAPADSTMAVNDQPAADATPAPAPTPAPKPAAPAPKPTPKPAAPAPPKITYVTLPAGTDFTAASNDSLHSRHDKPGKVITANINEDVKDSNGVVAIPAGSVVTLTVVTLDPAKSSSAKDGKINLSIKDVSINGKTVGLAGYARSVEHTLQGQGVTAGGAARVGGGAAAGAIAGKIIGGKTGAIVGGVAGAAGGAVVAAKTADRDVVVAPGAAIVIVLTSDLTVQK